MKKLLTISLSLIVFFAVAQQRTENIKPVNHGPSACPSLVVTPVDGATTTASDMIETILGPDIVSYTLTSYLGYQNPVDGQAALFTGGMGAGLGIEEGIMLSSGYARLAIGPNSATGIGASVNLPGDANLTALAGISTFDANVLQFDFVPNFTQLYIQFVFGSEEYDEYAFSINDVFAFYLNGTNIALVPSTSLPVSINNINYLTNTAYYKDNRLGDENFNNGVVGPYCTEMDGFTTVLVATGNVNPAVTNTIKLAIGDAYDHILDSYVFIAADSFGGVDPEVPISNWALFIGIGLILIFAVIRFRRLV
jgi:hypothetical protein